MQMKGRNLYFNPTTKSSVSLAMAPIDPGEDYANTLKLLQEIVR